MMSVWGRWGKPDLSMTMNGILGGLVAITAPCAFVTPGASIIIGALAGIFVVYGVVWVEKFCVDDPVGAVAVHGVNGIWGTLAVGIFGQKCLGLANEGLIFGGGFTQLGIQLLGSLTVVAFCIISMGIVFKIMKSTIGLRVDKLEELKGLDVEEHGIESYGDFQLFLTK
jgi:Amt family ammonium transporter